MNRMSRHCQCAALLLLGLAAFGHSQEVIDSVDVGGWNVDGLTYNSRAGVVYGRCYYGHNVFAVDCSTNQLVAQIPVRYPIDVAYSVTSNKAYCSFTNYDDSVLVIDGTTHTRIKTLPLFGAYLLKWDNVSNRLYVNCYTGGSDDCVAVIDCATDSVIATIPIPGEPVHLTINTRHHKLYCQNDANMTVSVIDMNTNQVIRNVYTGNWYFAQCYSEVAGKYYCDGAQGVAVIDGATDSVIKQIPLPHGYQPEAMVSVEPESLVMVAAYSGEADSVFMVDVMTDSIRSTVRVRRPVTLGYSPRAHVVYCAPGSSSNNLAVIAADGSRVLAYVGVGSGPQNLLVVPAYEKLYVGHGGETRMLYIVRDRVGVSEREGIFATPGRLPATVVTRTFAYDDSGPAPLIDASGRRVAVIRPGQNDLRALVPGVYAIVATDARYRRRVVIVK